MSVNGQGISNLVNDRLNTVVNEGIYSLFYPSRLDVVGGLRVSAPYTLFDSKQIADNQPLVWDDMQVSGGGTSSIYSANRASSTLSVSNLTSGKRVRQTRTWINYQPGRAQRIILTCVPGAITTGITAEWGYFNDNNGLFFRRNGTDLSVVVRSFVTGSVVETVVNQANWNLNKLDGSDDHGIVLDLTKNNIFLIDFIWLSGGPVHFGLLIDGNIYYVHQFNFANFIDSAFISSPNLPIRYSIENSGSGAADTIECICSTVQSEGGYDLNGVERAIDRDALPLTTLSDANIYPLIAIRLRSGYLGFTIKLSHMSLISLNTSEYRWMLLLNPTMIGTALSWTAVANSAIEADVATTSATTLTGGTLLASGYGQQSNSSGTEPFVELPPGIPLGSNIAGTPDIIVLAVQRLTGTTETFYASLAWREIG